MSHKNFKQRVKRQSILRILIQLEEDHDYNHKTVLDEVVTVIAIESIEFSNKNYFPDNNRKVGYVGIYVLLLTVHEQSLESTGRNNCGKYFHMAQKRCRMNIISLLENR